MITPFFRLAWRNIVKQRTFSMINIIGLAVGLACFLLIALYVGDELSYDRHHEHAERIYRVDADIIFGGSELRLAVSSDPMGATLKQDYPEVEQYARVYNSQGSKQIKKGDDFFTENAVCYADSTLFDVFTIPALEGNPRTALNEPNTVVISESAARKYFGRTDVIGQTIETDDQAGNNGYKVTAVIRDMPRTSHFRFDFLFSMDNLRNYQFGNFLSHNFHTYILLRPGTSPQAFEKHFVELTNKYILPQASQMMEIKSMDEFKAAGNKLEYHLTPLTDIHLRSDRFPEISTPGNIQYIYIFSAVALFILLLACVNFINLSTANSGNRAKEIGIRKVLGSERGALVRQFLAESLLTAFIASLIAVVLCWLCLSVFNNIAAKELSIRTLLQPLPLAGIAVLALVVGMVAGSYPAFYLSGFQPIGALKGRLRLSSSKSYLRNALVVFQFFIAIVLIIGTAVVYKQLGYIQNKNLGFHKDQVLILEGTQALGNNARPFMEALRKMNGVKSATQAGYLPVSNSARSDNTFSTESTMTSTNSFNMQNWQVDYDYIPTLGMELVEGRNFSREFGSDSSAIIINETAAKLMGGGKVLGKKIYTSDNNLAGLNLEKTIVGVVKNFHFESLRENVGPLSMQLGNARWSMALKVSATDLQPLIKNIERQFRSMAAGKPFSYSFLDQEFDAMYRAEQRAGSLALSFSVIAILIACLGLFGLATYMAQQRVKEIGVRKVLGATVGNIVTMLSTDFVKLVAIASVIAFPVAWYAMDKWLQDFAYRTSIQWWVFVLAAVIGLGIALLTVSYQAIKAALANPVKSLRTE
jgi:putative ABC transport system permease protein